MGSVDDTAEFDLESYKGSDNVQVAQGYLVVTVSFIIFQIINGLILVIGPRKRMISDVWRWRNTYVSWIHADVIGLAVIYCFIFRQDMFKDMILYCDLLTYSVVAASLGYFLYDMFDHIINGKVRSNWEVVLHHVGVIWCFMYALYYRINVGYTIMALLTEVNSIFLHARKLMQFDQWPFNHWLYRFVVVLNLVTFVVFRLTAVVCVGISAYLELKRITYLFAIFLSLVMTVMYFINPILLWRLFKNDVLRNIKGKSNYKSASNVKVYENGHVVNGDVLSKDHIR